MVKLWLDLDNGMGLQSAVGDLAELMAEKLGKVR